jgi:hypothetical protein
MHPAPIFAMLSRGDLRLVLSAPSGPNTRAEGRPWPMAARLNPVAGVGGVGLTIVVGKAWFGRLIRTSRGCRDPRGRSRVRRITAGRCPDAEVAAQPGCLAAGYCRGQLGVTWSGSIASPAPWCPTNRTPRATSRVLLTHPVSVPVPDTPQPVDQPLPGA